MYASAKLRNPGNRRISNRKDLKNDFQHDIWRKKILFNLFLMQSIWLGAEKQRKSISKKKIEQRDCL